MRRLSTGASGTTVRFLFAALLAGAPLGVPTATDGALAADRAAVADTDDDPAVEADQPRRAVLQGTLLVADQERAPWRLLSRGDELSTAGELRVAETAPVALAWDGAKLTADAGARLAASGAGALVLVEGRVYFDGAPTATPCALRAGDVAIEIPAGAALELSLGDDNVVRAIATRAPSAGQPPIKATAPGLTEPAEIARASPSAMDHKRNRAPTCRWPTPSTRLTASPPGPRLGPRSAWDSWSSTIPRPSVPSGSTLPART